MSTVGSSAALVVSDLHAGYGRSEVLHGLDVTVGAQEIVCVLGPNGAGKTTLLRTIAGLNRQRRGQLLWCGEAMRNDGTPGRVKRGVVLVPEGRQIFASMTTRENLLMGAFIRGRDGGVDDELERVYSYFPMLKGLDQRMGSAMSGGQQQMLAIARGLMARPKLLLLDEPSLGLAPIVVQSLAALLTQLPSAFGLSIMLVEQDTSLALSLSSRGYFMQSGRIVVDGTSATLRARLKAQNLFLVSHARSVNKVDE
jgi:branched-chain amino acid transport system ATP-binding protein